MMTLFLFIMLFLQKTLQSCEEYRYVSPCSCKDLNTTLVTALYDIHRNEWDKWKRSMDEYLIYFKQVLSLDLPMVIFVDKHLNKFVQENRKGKVCSTKIVIKSFEETEFYKYHKDIAKVFESHRFKDENDMIENPEGFSVDYIVITNTKADFVKTAATSNPFNTTHFFWIDAGYGHGRDIYPKQGKWAPCNLLKYSDIITFITFFDEEYYYTMFKGKKVHKLQIHPLINGGFFGGDKDTVLEFADSFKETFIEELGKDAVDDDQGTALQLYFKRPELFNFVRGNWYDVFELFK